MKIKFVLLSGLLAAFTAVQAADDFQVPRTEWGHPDIQGVWNFASNVPLTRPRQFGDRQYMSEEEAQALIAAQETAYDSLNEDGVGGYNTFWVESAGRGDNLRTSLLTYPENGQLPPTVEGVAMAFGGLGPDYKGSRPVRVVVGGISKDGPEDRGLSERCIVGFNSGPPFVPSMYNNNVQIIQNRDTVVIITEMIHDARIVPLDGRPHVDDDIRLWSGDSRGYWEGDSLVVQTKNFSDLTQSFGPFGDSFDKVLTERFTRRDAFTVDYEFTVEDPGTFKDKLVARVPMAKVDGLMYEYACHEGNYGMKNILRGERMAEQRSASAEGNP
ncbi:MAG: hypothetical protein WD772_06575 [Pseudohongiellaceae bacterium]